MSISEESLAMHELYRGKLEIASRVPLETVEDLARAYTPGVAEACLTIAKDPSRVWDLTMRGRSVAIVTDGSAVLGLGNIGAEAGLPVMEGKAVIYKKFANVDAWPILIDSQDASVIVETVKHIAPTFGAIHLEDIAAPRCFEVEERLSRELDIPVLHDDQHATAVVVLAGLLNALHVVGKAIQDVRIVINGAGAAGLASAHLLLDAGALHLRVLDTKGVITPGRMEGMNAYKEAFATRAFDRDATSWGSTLAEALRGSDVFLGVSQPGLLRAEDIATMTPKAIVFAMANPTPEIMPVEALAGGAAVVATGRSDFPNQVNNALVYPGIFLGALEGRKKSFTSETKLAAAHAVADLIAHPTAAEILPSVFHPNLARTVADAVKSV
ncbi:NADP-dependent malic enzyme [Candidatus Uhrbacteria bacterium]|nr:NADP-dependent malic enzyme [Candidatus Uhrbacteria bacterium]